MKRQKHKHKDSFSILLISHIGREGRQFHISPFTFRLLLFAAVIVCALILGLIAQIPVNYRQRQLLTARLSEQEKTIRALEEEKEALSSENKALARENDFLMLTGRTDEKEAEPVDVYVLDDKSEKVAGLRQNHLKAPIILLEKAEKDNDGNAEREAVISKPFSLNDFLNKLRSCINVFENSSDAYLAFNNYELHPAAKEILNRRNNELIKLTEKEVAVIKYLYKSKDKIVSKNDLLQDVWDYNAEVTTHTIETHIYRLRQKVEHDNPEAQLILTEDGGYKLKF